MINIDAMVEKRGMWEIVKKPDIVHREQAADEIGKDVELIVVRGPLSFRAPSSRLPSGVARYNLDSGEAFVQAVCSDVEVFGRYFDRLFELE